MHASKLATIFAAGSLAVAVPIAQGASKQHRLKLTIKDATITSQGDRPGDKQTTAGLVSGSPIGNGVESIADRVTTVTNNTVSFSGAITIYTSHGSISGTIKINVKPQSSGGATGTGSGKITAGTGRYAGAHGTFTFTGAESASTPVFVSHGNGTISY